MRFFSPEENGRGRGSCCVPALLATSCARWGKRKRAPLGLVGTRFRFSATGCKSDTSPYHLRVRQVVLNELLSGLRRRDHRKLARLNRNFGQRLDGELACAIASDKSDCSASSPQPDHRGLAHSCLCCDGVSLHCFQLSLGQAFAQPSQLGVFETWVFLSWVGLCRKTWFLERSAFRRAEPLGASSSVVESVHQLSGIRKDVAPEAFAFRASSSRCCTIVEIAPGGTGGNWKGTPFGRVTPSTCPPC